LIIYLILRKLKSKHHVAYIILVMNYRVLHSSQPGVTIHWSLDAPVRNLVLKTVTSDPNSRNDGNRLVGELLVRAPPVCLGPYCKV
jgi:hypothetical protein